jgi:hypothetical protein
MKPRLAKLCVVACGNSQSEHPPFDPGPDRFTHINCLIDLKPVSSFSKTRFTQEPDFSS